MRQSGRRQGASPLPQYIINNIDHVGIFIGDNTVVEATRKYGVIQQTLANFLAGATYNVSVTLNQMQAMDHVVYRAKDCLGLPYNHSFYPQDTGIYCSQLITHCFVTTHKKSYFQQYPMNFIDHQTGQFLPYWIKYYQALGLAIPQGVYGSHPQQLLRQTDLLQGIKLINNDNS